MYYGNGGLGMWYGLMGFIIMLLFLAVIVGLSIYLIRRPFGHWQGYRGHESGRHSANSARAILDERFARGEIDVEEYKLRREALRTEE